MHKQACTILRRRDRSITSAISRHVQSEAENSISHDNIERLTAESLPRDDKIQLLLGKEGCSAAGAYDDDEDISEEDADGDPAKLVIEDVKNFLINAQAFQTLCETVQEFTQSGLVCKYPHHIATVRLISLINLEAVHWYGKDDNCEEKYEDIR
jgi:hypothetical protein